MKKRQFTILALGLTAVVAALAGFLPRGKPAADVGTPPPALARLWQLQLPDLAGEAKSLARWQGKVLVVNFWATWCPPCREEIPGFERLSRKYAARNVEFVGIGIDSPEKIREFIAGEPVTYTLLSSGAEALQVLPELGNRSQGLPFTLVLDAAGAVSLARLGLLPEPELDRLLDSLAPAPRQ
ncbi:MAG: TlpA family protein disulfide reductase [Betaproteobacteria bacterium]|nr:TlpA family protein disulfide reductase [Betaproteobacteria bacterium]